VHAQSLNSAREARIDAPGATYPIDSLYVDAYSIAFSPDGTKLFASGAFHDPWPVLPPPDGEFIAVLNPQVSTVLARIGPLQARQDFGLATLPPGPAALHGAILVVGSRRRQGEGPGNTVDQLWVIDPTTYAITDSLQPEPSPPAGHDALLTQVVASPDGRHAYVVSNAGAIYECDLAAHAAVASAPAFGTGQLAIAPDGQTLYLTDQGDYFDTPGSGQVFVYGADLSPRPSIDLRPAFGGGVPVTHGIAVSPSDTLLYVATGTGSLGPNYGPQPLQLLIIDLTGHTPVRKVPLHDYGTATLQVLSR
jgi:DNA-binding beta-propeller fold protein YncE